MADVSLVATGGVACTIAAAVWYVAIREQRRHREWCAKGVKAQGVVSRLSTRGHLSRNEPTDSDNISEVPIVRFRAANGVEYEIDAPDAPRKVGTPVEVAYEPASPSSGRAVERVPKIGCAVVVLVIGIALVIAGLLK